MVLTNITMENLPFSMGFQQNPHGLYRPGPAGGRRELVGGPGHRHVVARRKLWAVGILHQKD